MSVQATHWVYTSNRTSRGNDRLVLLAFANEADSNTGACFPSVDLLAHHTLAHRSTVMDCIDRLERDGQLLVKRPDKRGRGRHNQYVVVMDRDPFTLADALGWSRPPLSPAALARRATVHVDDQDVPSSTAVPGVPSPSRKPGDRTEYSDVPSSDAPPTPATEHAPTEGVPSPHNTLRDRLEEPDRQRQEWSGIATITRPEWSDNGRTMVAPEATIPSPNPNPSVQRARSTQPVDKLTPPIRDLAGRLAAAGHITRWDLHPQQVPLVEAQLVVLGADAMVDAALMEAARKGTPRSARAWVDGWTALVPPPGTAASAALDDLARGSLSTLPTPCGHCDPNRWITNHDGLPVAKCPTCHPAFAGPYREERHA